MNDKSIAIIGAGPSGLTAAYELTRSDIKPVVLEKTDKVGGIARTETYKGCHFDIGGHRFLTRIEQINRLWHKMLGKDLLEIQRMSRIYYRRRFFHYPLKPINAFLNLGVWESIYISLSYLKAQIRPFPKEKTFEQWVSNRFGRRLYQTFFKAYTEKVWGIPCDKIQADWAVQRIKGLSLISALMGSLTGIQRSKTLADKFHYPRMGSGMMWDCFDEAVQAGGGQIKKNTEVIGLHHENGQVTHVECRHGRQLKKIPVEYLISSMPVTRLVPMLEPQAPDRVLEAAANLSYRSFIIVILIIDLKNLFPDQWIYIHSPDIQAARIQNFKNWSAEMVPNTNKTSIGIEYFCNQDDGLWSMTDKNLSDMASREMSQTGLIRVDSILDYFVIRQPDAYPVYNDSYKDNVNEIKEYLSAFVNLQTIGRNGMHRYNNMDHSMLSGLLAAKNHLGDNHDLWDINEEKEYLEEDKDAVNKQYILENLLGLAFARMDKLAFATAVGLCSGLLLFLATIWLVMKGGKIVGPNLILLSQYFVGYTVNVKGAFIAFGYSFFWGFLFGWLLAYLRNFSLSLYVFWVKKKTELLTLKDFFDHL